MSERLVYGGSVAIGAAAGLLLLTCLPAHDSTPKAETTRAECLQPVIAGVEQPYISTEQKLDQAGIGVLNAVARACADTDPTTRVTNETLPDGQKRYELEKERTSDATGNRVTYSLAVRIGQTAPHEDDGTRSHITGYTIKEAIGDGTGFSYQADVVNGPNGWEVNTEQWRDNVLTMTDCSTANERNIASHAIGTLVAGNEQDALVTAGMLMPPSDSRSVQA